MDINGRVCERLGLKLGAQGCYPRFIRVVVWNQNGTGVEIFGKRNWHSYPREWKIKDRLGAYKRVEAPDVMKAIEGADSVHCSAWGRTNAHERPWDRKWRKKMAQWA